MKKRLLFRFGAMLFCLAAALVTGWTGVRGAQQGKIPDVVWQKAQMNGVVRVIVLLDVPVRPEGELSREAVVAQRRAIATAQDKLLASLAGKTFRVTGRLVIIPVLGLEAGWDVLTVLELSPLVVHVTDERPEKPLLPQSVPLVQADQAWGGWDNKAPPRSSCVQRWPSVNSRRTSLFA